MHRLSWIVLLALAVALPALAVALPALAAAAVYTDDFEGGANTAGWSFIPGGDVIESNGGNPGGWLHQSVYDTFDPAVQSAWGNLTPFAGDYRARQVSRLSFDALNLDMDFPPGTGLYIAVLLRNTHGTPDDFDDDDYAYFLGPNIPLVGQGWVHYSVDIPSQSDDPVPAGWTGGWSGDCASFRPGVSWGDVITNVDRVELHWLDPCMFAIFQQWNVGADNISIEYETSTPTTNTTWGTVKQLFRH